MKLYFISILAVFLFIVSCNTKQEAQVAKDLYLETINFDSEVQDCVMNYFLYQLGTDSMIFDLGSDEDMGEDVCFTAIYRFRDASTLPSSNLLDGTRKFVITFIDKKDTTDYFQYQVESFKTEQSKWKRVGNSMNSMPAALKRKDGYFLSKDEICDYITSSVHLYVYKYMP